MPRQPRAFRAEAIVLKHNEFGEADRMLTLFTREKGKLRAIAKGARKVRSRKGGHLEPFTHVNLLLAQGRDLHIVTQAEAVQAYLPLRADLPLLGYASYSVELLDKFVYDEEENRAIFRLLLNTLTRLSRGDQPQLVLRYYEIHLLDLLGFRPELQHCVKSGMEIKPQDQYFSAELGGVLSPAYGKDTPRAVPVSLDALRYLRHFQRSSYQQAQRARISPQVQRELEVLVQHYITYLLERGLNSPAFLRRMLQEQDGNGRGKNDSQPR